MAGSGTPEYQEYGSLRQLLTICQLYHGRQWNTRVPGIQKFKTTSNNMSVISWQAVYWQWNTRVPGTNY